MKGGGGIQAVILAGGLGVRLRPLTLEVPKPMVPVAGKPYLEHQLEELARQRIRDVILLTGYLGEQIEQYFGDGAALGLSIRYSREPEPLGTGGALIRALPLLARDFVLIYGDSYLPMDYSLPIRRLRGAGCLGVLVIYDNRNGDTGVANNIAVAPDGRITRYEKGAPQTAGLTHVDAGVAALRRSVLEEWNGPPKFSLEREIYTELIRRGELHGLEVRQRFYDIGTPERLKVVEEFFRA